MKEIKGNIWSEYQQAKWIVVPTNGTVKNNGEAVMGRGIALQASMRFPHLKRALGRKLAADGNKVYSFHVACIITFPVKHNWYEKADIELIARSAEQLKAMITKMNIKQVYVPRVGCGNGKLSWKQVKPVLENVFDDRFIIVSQDE